MPPPPLHSQLTPCACFLPGFPGPQAGAVFLSCSSGLPVRQSPSCIGLELFFWASCPLGQPWFPVLWSPCGVSRFAALSLVLSGHRVSCILVRWVLSTLRWCSTVSLLFVGLLLVMVQPVLFLFSVSLIRSWGRCSPRLPPFRLLVSSRLALSVCRRVLWASIFYW